MKVLICPAWWHLVWYVEISRTTKRTLVSTCGNSDTHVKKMSCSHVTVTYLDTLKFACKNTDSYAENVSECEIYNNFFSPHSYVKYTVTNECTSVTFKTVSLTCRNVHLFVKKANHLWTWVKMWNSHVNSPDFNVPCFVCICINSNPHIWINVIHISKYLWNIAVSFEAVQLKCDNISFWWVKISVHIFRILMWKWVKMWNMHVKRHIVLWLYVSFFVLTCETKSQSF